MDAESRTPAQHPTAAPPPPGAAAPPRPALPPDHPVPPDHPDHQRHSSHPGHPGHPGPPDRPGHQGARGPQGHAPRRGPRGALSRTAVPAGVLAAVVGAFAYVGAVDPNEPGHYPVCPLLRVTGIHCPGCGGLRSAHAVVHGDLVAALHANALAVLAYAGFAVLWTVWVIRTVRGRPFRIALGPAHLWTLGTLLLVFGVVRNLPFGGWLLP